MLKVPQSCKEAIDAYFSGLDEIDRLQMTPGEKEKAMARMTQQTVKEPRFKDKIAEYVINSYISGLSTIAVNAMSAIVKAPLAITERFLLGIMPGNSIKLGESKAMLRGLFEGITEGITFGKAGWFAGAPLDTKENVDQIRRAIGGQSGASEFEKKLGEVVRVPTRASVAIDEFSKGIFRRMQFNAMASRLADTIPESKLEGLTREQMYQKLRQTDLNSLEWANAVKKINPTLAQDITDFAKAQTFQADLGAIGNTMLKLRAEHPELVFVAPFIKTPINILKDALSYTPASMFMKQFKGKKEEALARTMIGAGLGVSIAYQVAQGNLTGSYPKDSGRREGMIAAGIPEYSIKLGDTWYSYARIEPLATVLGVFSDSVESMRDYYNKPKAEQKIEQLAVDGVLAITKNLTSKTFLEGISGMLQALHDPERYGGQFLNGYAGLLVPAAIAQTARIPDPYQREVRTFGDAIAARVPGQRDDLPVKVDLLGEPKLNPAYGVAGVLGISNRADEQTPLQQEIADTNFAYTPVPKKIRGVELDATTYEKYAKISGDYANKYMSQAIDTPMYQNSSPAVKRLILQRVAEKSRKAATNQIIGEQYRDNPEFAAEYRRQLMKRKGVEEVETE
jgi:hypothetical protein